MGIHSWQQLPAPFGYCPPPRATSQATRTSLLSDAQETAIVELEGLASLCYEMKLHRGCTPDSRIMPAPERRLWMNVSKSSMSSWRLDDHDQAPYLLVAIHGGQVYGSSTRQHCDIFVDCLPIRQFVLEHGIPASELAELVFDLRTL